MSATWVIPVVASVFLVAVCPVHSRPSNTINSHHHHHHHRHGHHEQQQQQQAALNDAALLEELNQTLNSWNVSNTSLDDIRLSNLSKTARESHEVILVDRNREMRLQAIKQQIMSYRQHPSTIDPPPTFNIPPNIFDKIAAGTLNISHQLPPFASYTMKRQSFHPSCTLPNNTDFELWSEGNSMNLLFNLTYKAPANTSVTIVAATLRLYKHSQNNHTMVEQTCAPLVAPLSSEPQLDAPVLPPVTTPDEDKKIRASIYWYTRSLKKNKVKRKLVDSRMLSVYGNEWVEFNVRPAAKQWRASGKNFGLVVEVEDEDGEVLRAQDYFSVMNCSHEQQQDLFLQSSSMLPEHITPHHLASTSEEMVASTPMMPPTTTPVLWPTMTSSKTPTLQTSEEAMDTNATPQPTLMMEKTMLPNSTVPHIFIRYCSQ